jgi:hypothetical protein
MAITSTQLKAWSPAFNAMEAAVVSAKADPYQRYDEAWNGRVVIVSPDIQAIGGPVQRTAGFAEKLKAVLGPARAVNPGTEPTVAAALSTQEAYDVGSTYLFNLLNS